MFTVDIDIDLQTAAWVWRLGYIGYNLQKEYMSQGHCGVETNISRKDLSCYQDTVMSRVWKTWVIQEPHGSQVLNNQEPCQCKFSAAYLLSPNSPKWRRRSRTPRQKRVNGRKRRNRGAQMGHQLIVMPTFPTALLTEVAFIPLPQQNCLNQFITKSRGYSFISLLTTMASKIMCPQMKADW